MKDKADEKDSLLHSDFEDLDPAYLEMSKDIEREKDALEVCEALVGDVFICDIDAS